jgi:hypothetical protein
MFENLRYMDTLVALVVGIIWYAVKTRKSRHK